MTSTVGVPDLTGAIDTDVLIVVAGGRRLALSPDRRTNLATLSIFGARDMRPAWTAASPVVPTTYPQVRREGG
jgi:hypothetical protein